MVEVERLIKKKHLIEKKNKIIIHKRQLNQTIEDNKVHVDYAIKFFQ